MQNLKRKKGFTLIEMIVVIAIIAILITIAVPGVVALIGNADNVACEANRHSIEDAYKLMYIKNPDTAKPDDMHIVDTLIAAGFLSEPARCPEGGTYMLINGKAYCTKHYPYGNSSSGSSDISSSVSSSSSSSSSLSGSSASGSISSTTSGTSSSGTSSGSGSVPNQYLDVSYAFSTNGNHYTLTLYNNSHESIKGWKIDFNFPIKIVSAYDSTLTTLSDTHYTIMSKDNNLSSYTIAPGASYQIKGDLAQPNNNNFTITNVVITKTYSTINASVQLSVTEKWNPGQTNEGHNFTVTIVNNTTEPIVGWDLEFNYNGVITSVWNAVFTNLGNGRYRFVNPNNYNITIPPNNSLSFGGQGTKAGTAISNATLNGVSVPCYFG